MKQGEFEGRHVVVTGGTGALGGAVLARLLAAGASCHVPVRKAEGLASRERLEVCPGVDLTDEDRVREFYAALPSLWASIHCAGGFAMAPVAETSHADFARMVSINAVSTFLCCREAVLKIRAGGTGGGRIVNVAAAPALEPRRGAGMTAYTASKAAVAALTEALAEELAPEGVWVNAVAPSVLDTAANRRAMPGADPSRWVRVEDVAEAIAFLASPSNGAARGSIVRLFGKS